jgi:hypothetical protein
MVLINGGTVAATVAQRVMSSGSLVPRPALPTGAASLERMPAVGSPALAPARSHSTFVFSLRINQSSDRVIMEWSDAASGLLVAEIPVETAAQAFEGSNDPLMRGSHINKRV